MTISDIRWDRRTRKWGVLTPGAFCTYIRQFDYGVLVKVTFHRVEVSERGCAPTDIVGWASGNLTGDNVHGGLGVLNLDAALAMDAIIFNGRDFYCETRLVISTPLMLMFKGGLCLVHLSDGSSQQQLSCSVAS